MRRGLELDGISLNKGQKRLVLSAQYFDNGFRNRDISPLGNEQCEEGASRVADKLGRSILAKGLDAVKGCAEEADLALKGYRCVRYSLCGGSQKEVPEDDFFKSFNRAPVKLFADAGEQSSHIRVFLHEVFLR